MPACRGRACKVAFEKLRTKSVRQVKLDGSSPALNDRGNPPRLHSVRRESTSDVLNGEPLHVDKGDATCE